MVSTVISRKNSELLRSFVLLLAVTATFVLGRVSPVLGEVMTDFEILGAVEAELLVDPAVNSNRILVAVDDGIVTLKGSVSNLLQKERATRLTGAIRGVRVVVNKLEIKPTGIILDSDLRQYVLDALLVNPATDSYEISVKAEDGVVELRGKVQSFQEKILAEKVAKSVHGTKDVLNLITVEYPKSRPDSEVAADVRETLRWDSLVQGLGIEVGVKDGVVKLSGVVGSLAEKNRAIADAWVWGVREVRAEDLKVDPLVAGKKTVVAVVKTYTDKDIKTAVESALLRDPRVNSLKVTTTVKDGVVTLRGEVDSLQAFNAADYAARTRLGVKRVKNHLKISVEGEYEDKEIAENLHRALLRDPYVERYEIAATVIDGTVYLTGRVDSRFEKIQAGLVASGIKGVEEVVNNIWIGSSLDAYIFDPYVDLDYTPDAIYYPYRLPVINKSDFEIYLDIRDQLFWSPFVDSDQVTVVVEDGVATLTGTVDSYFESTAAVENALDGGAAWVKNRLKIQ